MLKMAGNKVSIINARTSRTGKLEADKIVADGELVDSKVLAGGNAVLRLFVPSYIIGNIRYYQVEFEKRGEKPKYLLRNAEDRFPTVTDNLYEQINSESVFEDVQETLDILTETTVSVPDTQDEEGELLCPYDKD